MTTMKKLMMLAIVFLMAGVTTAQTVQINGVKGRFYNGVHSIEDYGYYTIYKGEKLKKGMVEYVLEIYDLDLGLIKKEKVVMTKTDNLVGAEFNGNSFLFAFYDLKKKTQSFLTFDRKGNQVAKEVVPVKKVVTAGSGAIFPARDGSGFYATKSVKEKKWGYSVTKLDNNAKTVWEKTYTRPKGVAFVVSAESSHGRLVLLTNERPSAMSKKVQGKLVAIDDKTGDEIYNYKLFDGTVTYQPSSLLILDDGSVVSAGMYFNGEKAKATNSDGIFFAKLDPSGKPVMSNNIDWDNGIQEAMKATSRKFSIGSKPKVVFHEIVEDANGGYQVIAETFRKTVKAGTVMGALGGNNNEPPPMGFTVMDYLIFNYDSNGNPIDINKIEKPYKSTLVDGRIAQQGGMVLSQYMKRMGMFTYEFTTTLEGSDDKIIVFTNFEDAKLGNGFPYVGMTTIAMGEESRTTKLPVTKKHTPYLSGSKNTKSGALKGRPGKMCLYVYSRKEKVINMTIENIAVK